MPDSETSSVVMVSPAELDVLEGEEATQVPADTQPSVTTTAESKAENDGNAKTKKAKVSKSEDSDEEDDEEGEDEAEDSKEKIIVGLIADIKNLYQKYDKHGCLVWTDQYPDDLEEAAENEETLKYAVIVRYSKSPRPSI
jgi:hypothetical protein